MLSNSLQASMLLQTKIDYTQPHSVRLLFQQGSLQKHEAQIRQALAAAEPLQPPDFEQSSFAPVVCKM